MLDVTRAKKYVSEDVKTLFHEEEN